MRDKRSTPGVASIAFMSTLLGGCTSLAVMSHVPVSTMVRLASLKLAEIVPSELRVAARLPEALEPRRDGVKVRLDVSGSSPAARRSADIVLEPAIEPGELARLSAHMRAGFRIWVYRLSAPDVERLKRFIAEAGGRSGVSIATGVDACHRKPLGEGRLLTTTFLRTHATDYFILTEELDLHSVVSERDLAARVPPCG